jgi:tetratricopeptide (TPR) repeat protein
MMKDHFGLAVSTASRAAVDKLDIARRQFVLFQGDPIAAVDAALAEDESWALAWGLRAALLATQMDAAYLEEARRSLRAGEAANGNAHERAHLAAARLWIEGRFAEAAAAYGRIAQDYPRDVNALQFAHFGDFYLGQQSELRDRPLQALRAWGQDEKERSAILGMAAFGLEECGDFARAEAFGREAVAIEPGDGWAVHAVAHVCEMQGRAADGAKWLRDGAHAWAPDNGFAYHNWWHLALFALHNEDHAEALELYDTRVRPAQSGVVLEMIDASALLWRLRLKGVNVGARFDELAQAWERTIDDGLYSFNDVHALFAFIGAGRMDDAQRIVANLRQRAKADDDNGLMCRMVGLPVAQALLDFEQGRYAAAADALHSVRAIAQRFGGSHAQRDILSLTLFEAALRAGRGEQAQAIAAERLAHKPESPWARSLAMRARDNRKVAA